MLPKHTNSRPHKLSTILLRKPRLGWASLSSVPHKTPLQHSLPGPPPWAHLGLAARERGGQADTKQRPDPFPFSFFHSSHTPPPLAIIGLFFISVSLFLLFCFVIDCTYKEIISSLLVWKVYTQFICLHIYYSSLIIFHSLPSF